MGLPAEPPLGGTWRVPWVQHSHRQAPVGPIPARVLTANVGKGLCRVRGLHLSQIFTPVGPSAPPHRKGAGIRGLPEATLQPRAGVHSVLETPASPGKLGVSNYLQEAWWQPLTTVSLSAAGGWETQYVCCSAAIGSVGCQVAKVCPLCPDLWMFPHPGEPLPCPSWSCWSP